MTSQNTPGWPPQGQPGFSHVPIPQERKHRGRGLKIIGLIAYGIVVLFIGVAIGRAGSKPAAPAEASAKSTTPASTSQNRSTRSAPGT
jgi:hypothetical protein